MPTNLPPDYFAAQSRYRAATTTADKLACLQEMLALIPKHKGTEHLVGDLRRRIAKLKAQAAQAPKKTGRRETAFQIDRAGAGQVAVVGPANVGKSALVAALSGVELQVADYPYTTREPAAAMMPFENVQIQLVDTPPLSAEYVEPELPQLLRKADLILVVVDVQTDPLQQLEETAALLEGYRIAPRHRQARCVEQRGMVFAPFLVVANKSEGEGQELYGIFRELLEEEWPLLAVSTVTGHNLDELKRTLFERLEIVRVYTKAPGKEPNRERPFLLARGGTVADLARKIHHDFLEQFALARVWGPAVYDGQPVGKDYVLQDEDVVELHT